VHATDPSMLTMTNTRDKQPFSHVGSGRKFERVVFIGDSNHAISPFTGNEANMALMDG
jgi:2-polyprenyl-6-methoxyphenol hydroxylase-like FAD-dependent oxidoreductase